MSPHAPSIWIPNTDVLVNAAGELVIKVELAAVTKEEIEIAIEGQRLTISGHRPDPDREGAHVLVLELHYGQFKSVLEVPPEFDLSRAQTAYQNGMLRIIVPPRST